MIFRTNQELRKRIEGYKKTVDKMSIELQRQKERIERLTEAIVQTIPDLVRRNPGQEHNIKRLEDALQSHGKENDEET